jgi:rifampicin phosphotransferase
MVSPSTLMPEASPSIVLLTAGLERRGLSLGGKAEGLVALLERGARVPPAFAILGAREDHLPDSLAAHYEALGAGRVAVRSSAVGEDGERLSYAGQFETILDVSGFDALEHAIARCLASQSLARVDAYRAHAGERAAGMTVIVQTMVDAIAAGVVFTVDPISGRRDRLVIDAVSGLGEALVSGARTPDHHVLDDAFEAVEREVREDGPALDDATLRAIAGEARRLAERFGVPLDLEWAIDTEGTLYFLQARPITRLPSDPRELDLLPDPSGVITRANIGEMMPGAVTPLTLSTTARGIDQGLQRMYVRLGARRHVEESFVFVGALHGHLNLSLTRMAESATYILGSTTRDVAYAICGREVPELAPATPMSTPRRLIGTARYVRALASIPRFRAKMEHLVATCRIARSDDPVAAFEAIDHEIERLFECYELHLLSSAGAGAMAPFLLGVVSRGKTPSEADHAKVASLLAGATQVESADIAQGITRIAHLARHEDERALEEDDASALAYLRSDESGAMGREFCEYLVRHGHRAVREAELRQVEWRRDPSPLLSSLRVAVGARNTPRRTSSTPSVPRAMRPLVALAHAAVRSRERTKSLLIEITALLRDAYRGLAQVLVAQGHLPDEDLVYFFTHEELGAFCRAPSATDVERAEARRLGHDYRMSCEFPVVWVGTREPLPRAVVIGEGDALGKPVSPGRVEGRACVARTLAEAAAVRPGDVLITPITDVGWTPYFAVIGGLATDVGSAVSHGAVVAREYGIPAAVGFGDATRRFRTGERVLLDGTRGILRRLEDDE